MAFRVPRNGPQWISSGLGMLQVCERLREGSCMEHAPWGVKLTANEMMRDKGGINTESLSTHGARPLPDRIIRSHTWSLTHTLACSGCQPGKKPNSAGLSWLGVNGPELPAQKFFARSSRIDGPQLPKLVASQSQNVRDKAGWP
jgi:hypothetical protein